MSLPPPRPASAADAGAVAAIAKAAFAPYFAQVGKRPAPMDDDYAALIARGDLHVMPGDRMTGFVWLRAAPDALWIETVAVLRQMQGKGIGRHLLRWAETEGKARGVPRMRLYTNAAMPENAAFYPRLGYRQTHRAIHDGFDRIFFEKPL